MWSIYLEGGGAEGAMALLKLSTEGKCDISPPKKKFCKLSACGLLLDRAGEE
jgi:hypothetical protein